MKTARITGNRNDRDVFVNGKKLDVLASQKVMNIANRFGWGVVDFSAHQTALAILLEFTDPPSAVAGCVSFANQHLATIDLDISVDVEMWLAHRTRRTKTTPQGTGRRDVIRRECKCGSDNMPDDLPKAGDPDWCVECIVEWREIQRIEDRERHREPCHSRSNCADDGDMDPADFDPNARRR